MDDDAATTFSDLLRRARRAAGLTQEDLAERAGLSARAISDLERGVNRAPRRDTLDMLGDALELAPDERRRWERARQRSSAAGAKAAPGGTAPSGPSNLPAPATRFIGRDDEFARLVALLREDGVRLVTLTGPGGSGKTRLSLEAASVMLVERCDGVYFVDLAPIADPALVLPAIAATIGVHAPDGGDALGALAAALERRRMLLVLDNLEQVIECAPSVGELLRRTQTLQVLATSRSPLRLQSEHELPVPPLPLPSSVSRGDPDALLAFDVVRLFVERVTAVRPDLRLVGEQIAQIARICTHLDGLPLAIELAAARVRSLPLAELAERLDPAHRDQRLSLLAGAARDQPRRQQSLRDTIAWSYDLLAPDEQRLFRSLSVFRGGWTLEAVEAVAGERIDVLTGLGHLIDLNLVQLVELPDHAWRYTMLETLRDFGLERLDAAGERDGVLRRHAGYFLPWAEQRGRATHGAEDETASHLALESERDNLRSAFEWTLALDALAPELLNALLEALGWMFVFWRARGRVTEGRRLLQLALARPDASDSARAHALNGAGALAAEQDDYAQAFVYHEEGLALALDLRHLEAQAVALWGLGRAAMWLGDHDQAVRAHEEGIALARREQRADWLCHFLGNYGAMWSRSGDIERGAPLLEEARAVDRENSGTPSAIILRDVAYVTMRRGDLDRARRILQRSLRLELPHGPSRLVAECFEDFAWLAVLERQPDRAATLLGAADALRERAQSPRRSIRSSYYDDLVALGHQQSTPHAWAFALRAGHALPLEAAVALALADAPRSGVDEPQLSAHEVELLRLLALGITDEEIGAALSLSRHAAANEVVDLIDKLEVSSRDAGASWAVERGVV
jgi:predicted ATPase/transcriptional regulator with XRE-family HTH domain/DNA-binding CsgD family transcriptional regulator